MPLDIVALRTEFRATKTALLDQFQQQRPTGASARRLLLHLAKVVDRTLMALWNACDLPRGVALVAVGGYGRAELFPHSDVDVLVLLPVSPSVVGDDGMAPIIEAFIGACWDIGLEIGSSVRSVAECIEEAQRDVTVQTSLLEARFVCGTKQRFEELCRASQEQMDAPTFMTAKLLEMRQRHTKFEDTPYALEPNCKESPGGCAIFKWSCGWRVLHAWARTGVHWPKMAC